MPDPVEALSSYARQFGVTPPAAPPATSPAFTFGLTTPPRDVSLPDIGALLPATETIVTSIAPGSLDLRWVTKDVRFDNTNILNEVTVGGMPVSDFILATSVIATSIGTATNGATNPPGVPGLLGHVSGTIPLVLQRTERTQPPQPPINASVRWRIRDERGAIVPVSWSIPGVASGTGGEILRTLGALPLTMPPPNLTLTFPLLFTEMSTRALPLPQRSIEVAIRLEVPTLGITSGWVDLPPVTITLPAIPIPSIAVFTEGLDFGGRVLVVVPSGSPFTTISEMTTALTSLVATLTPLPSIPGLSIFLSQFAPTGSITMALATPSVLFQVADSMPFMRNATWNRGWLQTNVVDAANAEDSISAIALIGPPGRTIECFNAREFAPHEGQINITTGAGIMTTIRDLNSASPPCDPPGNISIPRPPGGSYWFHSINTFDNELSSMRFV
jgi:hypothetical protein